MNPVQTFLRNHYSDARLVELLQHCQDGKFAFRSCCCFIGIATADHELQGFTEKLPINWPAHLEIARELPGADEAEHVIWQLENDTDRRAYLIPLIEAEIAYRGANHVEADSDLVSVADVSGVSGVCGVADCRHADRNEAMNCIFYRANKTDQVGKFHGPNHFELSQVSALMFGCPHESVAWPQSGWQRCLDCGAKRRYRRIGCKPGPWLKEVEVISAETEEESQSETHKATAQEA